jgi:hypothetical protein
MQPEKLIILANNIDANSYDVKRRVVQTSTHFITCFNLIRTKWNLLLQTRIFPQQVSIKSNDIVCRTETKRSWSHFKCK